MTVSKTDLINFAAEKAQTTKKAAEAVVDAFLTGITEHTKFGNKVIIRGFGTFQEVHRAERNARNPATGAMICVPASATLKFKAAKAK